jgi:hypothetical protein
VAKIVEIHKIEVGDIETSATEDSATENIMGVRLLEFFSSNIKERT